MTTRPLVEKFPLRAKKSIRDEFELKRPELEETLTRLLGNVPWTIDVDPRLLFAYTEPGDDLQNSIGNCIYWYIDGAIWQLKGFLESRGHGAEGVAEINHVAAKHIITIYPDVDNKASYCGCDIKDGVLRILFAENQLGVNVSSALEDIESALNQAGASDGLSYSSRNSIKQGWTVQAEELRKHIAEQVHNPDLKLNPNFEAVGLELAKSKDVRDDWEKNLGGFTKNYFESLLYYLKQHKFQDDDLMYEGFNEMITKGEVLFRIVDQLTGSSSYNQCLVEDGVLVLQTTPAKFGTNIDGVAEKILDIL